MDLLPDPIVNLLTINDIIKAVILSGITGIIGFNTFKLLILNAYANLKNRSFNGYWILMIFDSQDRNFVDLIRLREGTHGTIINKRIRNKIAKKLSEHHKWKFNGYRMSSSLLANLQIENEFEAGCSYMISENINCYWEGKYLHDISESDIGIACTISLTKVSSIASAMQLLSNSDSRSIKQKFNVSKKNCDSNVAVSIIITTYNDAANIGNCLDSILNQDITHAQIIVIDDGSYDDTVKIISSYIQRFVNKEQFVFHRSLHKGTSFSRNIGLTYATGKYILFVDSDDSLEIDVLDDLVELTKSDHDIIIGGYYDNSLESGIVKHIIPSTLARVYTINEFISMRKELSSIRLGASWGKLYKSRILKQNDCQFERAVFEDTIFNIEFQKFANSVYVDSRAWYKYNRTNPKSKMNQLSTSEYIVGQYYVLSRYIKHLSCLVSNAEIENTLKDECVRSYTQDIMNRINRKTSLVGWK